MSGLLHAQFVHSHSSLFQHSINHHRKKPNRIESCCVFQLTQLKCHATHSSGFAECVLLVSVCVLSVCVCPFFEKVTHSQRVLCASVCAVKCSIQYRAAPFTMFAMQSRNGSVHLHAISDWMALALSCRAFSHYMCDFFSLTHTHTNMCVCVLVNTKNNYE